MSKILFQNSDGGLSVVHSTGVTPIEDLCHKCIPAGTPYLIVEDDVIPSDRSFRDAWEADFSNPTGTSIGREAWFAAKAAAEQSEEVSE
jgi:hypothetical protein